MHERKIQPGAEGQTNNDLDNQRVAKQEPQSQPEELTRKMTARVKLQCEALEPVATKRAPRLLLKTKQNGQGAPSRILRSAPEQTVETPEIVHAARP